MGYIDIVRPTPNHNEQPVIYYNVYTAYNTLFLLQCRNDELWQMNQLRPWCEFWCEYFVIMQNCSYISNTSE